jgi:hypothetical protein
MASTPATEAAGRGATLSGDVVVRETVEAETHKLRRDRAVAFGCHIPRVAPLTTTHDSLESMSVDVGPSMELPGRVRHQHRTPRAEAPAHRYSRRRLRTKATQHGHTRGVQRWSPTAVGRTGSAFRRHLHHCRAAVLSLGSARPPPGLSCVTHSRDRLARTDGPLPFYTASQQQNTTQTCVVCEMFIDSMLHI